MVAEAVFGGSFRGARVWIAPISGVLVDFKAFSYVNQQGKVEYRYQLVLDRADAPGYQYKVQCFDPELLDLSPSLGEAVRINPNGKRRDERGFPDERGAKFVYVCDLPASVKAGALPVAADAVQAVEAVARAGQAF